MDHFKQGSPCWYELGTTDLDAAARFYQRVLGWKVEDADVPGFDYRQASRDGHAVAGMMELPAPEGGAPQAAPGWLIYFVVDDADASVAAMRNSGGRLDVGPQDIPGVGRFAMLGDPQGAAFGVLQPGPMSEKETAAMVPAFDQQREGHGQWNELMTTDPKAALEFYGAMFGWTRSKAMDMGQMGTYQLIAHEGTDIGAIMGLGNAPASCWLPYFGVDAASAAMQRIEAAGGSVLHGPIEVPGPRWIAVARDPQGARFAVLAPAK